MHRRNVFHRLLVAGARRSDNRRRNSVGNRHGWAQSEWLDRHCTRRPTIGAVGIDDGSARNRVGMRPSRTPRPPAGRPRFNGRVPPPRSAFVERVMREARRAAAERDVNGLITLDRLLASLGRRESVGGERRILAMMTLPDRKLRDLTLPPREPEHPPAPWPGLCCSSVHRPNDYVPACRLLAPCSSISMAR